MHHNVVHHALPIDSEDLKIAQFNNRENNEKSEIQVVNVKSSRQSLNSSRNESQSKQVPIDGDMMGQTKTRHRQDLGDAKFSENRNLDVEKLPQDLYIATEEKNINEFFKANHDLSTIQAVTVGSPHQNLSLQTDLFNDRTLSKD